MTRPRRAGIVALIVLLVLATAAAWFRARGDRSRTGVLLTERYAAARSLAEARLRGDRVHRDVMYVERPGWRGRLDLYVPAEGGSHPVVVYFHGGGWMSGSKDLAARYATEHRRLGYAVANVEYRLTPQARAPAALADARCAVRWLAANGARFGIDGSRMVTAGHSAGGHLALMAALAREGDGFDEGCQGADAAPAAVLNWYGPSDLSSLLGEPDARGFTSYWLGDSGATAAFADRLSPLAHVRERSPAILTVHGALDALVPVEQSQRLHARLDSAGVPNRLLVVPDGGHGFAMSQTRAFLDSARAFLDSALAARRRAAP